MINGSQAHRRFLAALCFVLIFAGCSRDPNVRKADFVHKGDEYFHKAKYPEALISYAQALQIDPRYVPAYYQTAQCQIRLGNYPSAFQALTRTVELQPDHWAAQLDLGRLYLGSGNAGEAKKKANLIIQGDPKNVDARLLLSNAEAALG
jgi:tetratricopeptide (TPR) repeat protein